MQTNDSTLLIAKHIGFPTTPAALLLCCCCCLLFCLLCCFASCCPNSPRADHTASKYLKDNVKVPKVKDESSVKESLKRGVTRFNPF
jgi:hypothetical protein